MISDNVDRVRKNLFGSFRSKYQNDLQSMRVISLSLIMFSYCVTVTINQT